SVAVRSSRFLLKMSRRGVHAGGALGVIRGFRHGFFLALSLRYQVAGLHPYVASLQFLRHVGPLATAGCVLVDRPARQLRLPSCSDGPRILSTLARRSR